MMLNDQSASNLFDVFELVPTTCGERWLLLCSDSLEAIEEIKA